MNGFGNSIQKAVATRVLWLLPVGFLPMLRAELAPVLCKRGKVIFAEDFANETVTERWFFREQWFAKDGAMCRSEVAGENQRVFAKGVSYGIAFLRLPSPLRARRRKSGS